MVFNLAHAIDVLRRTPGTLRVLLQDIPAPLARGTEGPDGSCVPFLPVLTDHEIPRS